MKKIKFKLLLILYFSLLPLSAYSETFDQWKINFSDYAKFKVLVKKHCHDHYKFKILPKVIEYDRYQPEFYEDTYTYIEKRTNNKKVKIGQQTYKKYKFN